MNPTALFIVLAISAVALAMGLLALSWRQRAREARLGRRYSGESVPEGGLDSARGRAWVAGMAEAGARIDTWLKHPGETRMLLAQAGWRDARFRRAYLALQFALPLLFAVLALGLFGIASRSLIGVLLGLMVVIVGVLAPRHVLRAAARRRRARIRAEVPLFINVLLLLFEAGLNLRQALSSLAQDSGAAMPVLVQEIRPLMRQIEAGADADRLLFETGRLLAVEELDAVLAVLRQVDRYGGEIREPLLAELDNLESRREMALREQVNVMSGKMTVVLVICFLPPLLIFIAGPALMSISASFGAL